MSEKPDNSAKKPTTRKPRAKKEAKHNALTDKEELTQAKSRQTIGLGWFAGENLSPQQRREKLRAMGYDAPEPTTPNATIALMSTEESWNAAGIPRDTAGNPGKPRDSVRDGFPPGQLAPATNPENDQGAKITTESTDSNQPEAPQPASKQNTPRNTPDTSENETGDVPLAVAEAGLMVESQAGILVALAREGEGRAACWERLRKESRAAGMPRGQGPGTAYEWATREVERLFPPKPEPVAVELEPEPAEPEPIPEPVEDPEPTEPPPAPTPIDQGVPGLGTIPADWPSLAANASLQAEISWVSANRLRVRDGSGVDLSRALSPAPSYSALSWLETSILFPSKFADISVKATQNQEDEAQHVRRERMAIEEIRALLGEMLEGDIP